MDANDYRKLVKKGFEVAFLVVKYNAQICMHEGCWEPGYIECYLPDWNEERTDDKPDCFHCGQHAALHGFCRSCGLFWAGIESFDFIHPGYCDNCHDQIERDFRDDWEDDEDWEDPLDCEYGLEMQP